MMCPKCGGDWIVKRTGFMGIRGPKRHTCKKCGYLDERKVWVNDEYVGPPELLSEKDHIEKENERLFFNENTMPCCLNSPIDVYEGATGGMCTNIECAYCGARWNITALGTIEKI